MGDEEDFAVWRPPSLISFDEYYKMKKTSKEASRISKEEERVLEKRSTHSSHSNSKTSGGSSRRREGRKSLQHLSSMDESLHAIRPPPTRPSPRTTPNQRLRKKSVKQHTFAMKELIDLLEFPSQSPAVVHSRKYRVSNEDA
jgi:hypothetical protein